MPDLNLTVNLPDPSTWFNPSSFVSFWQTGTGGVFAYGVLALAVLAVWMRTKSPSLTAVIAIAGLVIFSVGKFLVFAVVLALAYLFWRVIWKRTPYE